MATKSSASGLTKAMITPISSPDGLHEIYLVNLSDSIFNGSSFSVSVTKKEPHGDGQLYNLEINAGNNNIGAVSIGGDLGYIDAGSGSSTIPAIKSLTANTIGRYEGTALAAGTIESSSILGSVSKLAVKGDMSGTYFAVNGNIDSISIGDPGQ